MGHDVTIGGERLGSGKKMKAYLHNYERSSHDLSYVIRTTMAAGTLVPFMTELALPGDTFDINLNCDVLTHPTIGPLFGSYKIQLDVFQVPIRLYQGKLHMNMLNIGNDMSKVPLPQMEIDVPLINITQPIDNQQINPSCILSYLGVRGVGNQDSEDPGQPFKRRFNAIPYLGYWDIYKNYYANKQEEIGAVIHMDPDATPITITDADIMNLAVSVYDFPINPTPPLTYTLLGLQPQYTLLIIATGITANTNLDNIILKLKNPVTSEEYELPATSYFGNWNINPTEGTIVGSAPLLSGGWFGGITYSNSNPILDTEPQVKTFNLSDIDTMRQQLLSHFSDTPKIINADSPEPYNLIFKKSADETPVYSKTFSQEGLALKTYNSDLFNNWIDTEWIDGTDGISEVTAIDTSGGSFTLDELNLSKKIYVMLNRIAISGGSYDDWLDAVFTHERTKQAENPMYLGGLIQKLVFQEVVSNSASADQPLGTLAGRGRVSDYKKGGQIVAKIDEPSYLMGIVSLTPNIDYSQGNKWDMSLKTMNDLHKPALDEIGFQDLVTDQMAWFDTPLFDSLPIYKSAGKQPAWINYMTNINRVLGNFADQRQQMFMVLNRRYNVVYDEFGHPAIADLTTYIDPTKFNHIFADTRRDAQNFWTQIGVNIEARRKMSAKVIPNL